MNRSSISAATSSSGDAGTITVRGIDPVSPANSISLSNGSISTSVNENAAGAGGKIDIEARSLFINDGASVVSSTFGEGEAGEISVRNVELISLSNGLISTETSASGEGGGITIETERLMAEEGARISATATRESSAQRSGTVRVNASQIHLSGEDAGVFAQTQGTATAGSILLSPNDNEQAITINLQTGTEISASTLGSGQGGNVVVTAPESITISGAGLLSAAQSLGDGSAGRLEFKTDQLTVRRGTQVTVSSTENRQAGSLIVDARNVVLNNQASLSAITEAGTGANITFRGIDQLNVQSSLISAETENGVGGNLTVNANQPPANRVFLSGSFKSEPAGLSVRATGNGQAGRLEINAREIIVQDGAALTAQNESSFLGGNISIEGLRILEISGGGRIAASTRTGVAGNVTINSNGRSADSIVISGRSSRITAQAEQGGGSAGRVSLNARDVNVQNRAQITVSNVSGQSDALSLRGIETLRILNGGEITASTQIGRAGNVRVNSNEAAADLVVLQGDGSRLVARATGEGGIAGGVELNTTQLTVGDNGAIATTNISEISGTVNLRNLSTLVIQNNGQISASTRTGQAGNVIVEADKSVSLLNEAEISVEATDDRGNAGTLNIRTPDLSLGDRSTISASTQSGVSGDVVVEANTLQLDQDSVLSASTQTGRGGNVIVRSSNAGELIDIALDTNSQISATASGDGQTPQEANGVARRSRNPAARTTEPEESTPPGGVAGSVTITNANQLMLRGGSAITVSSGGSEGIAGSVTVEARQLDVGERSQISATTTSGDGGDLNLTLDELLLLSDNSLISTTAGTDQRGGNGGDITINTRFITTLPQDDSDIRANAFNGQGGNIDITAGGLFGIAERPQPTSLSDITASSEFGLDGTVLLNTPGIDPSRGLAELPLALVDTDGLVERDLCRLSSNSRFTATGRGGLPPTPNEVFTSDDLWHDQRLVHVDESMDDADAEPHAATEPASMAPATDETSGSRSFRSAHPHATNVLPTVEAQSWQIDPSGTITLMAEGIQPVAQPMLLSHPSCQTLTQ